MRLEPLPQELKRRITKDATRRNEERDDAFRRIVRSVPKGKVTTYARIAEAAGYPLYHRAVAQLLRRDTLTSLPWQRVVGSNGEIRLKGEFAEEQRFRLRMEGVRFEGDRLNLTKYQHHLCSWDTISAGGIRALV